MSLITHGLLVRIVAPVRIHMHPYEIHPPAGSKDFIDHPLVVAEACVDIIIVPAPVVEERAICLSETMKIHDIAFGILQVASHDIEFKLGKVRRRVFHIRFFLFRFLFFFIYRRFLRNIFLMAKTSCKTQHHCCCDKQSLKYLHNNNYLALKPLAKPAYAYLRL